METQCRAKDPSTCRVHGSHDRALPISKITDNSHLKEIADNASATGDVELFIQAKAQMDKNNREAAPSSLAPSANEVSDRAGEAAAEGRWKAGEDSDPYHVSWESLAPERKTELAQQEQKLLAEALHHMPRGVITDEVVEEMAIYRQNTWSTTHWNRLWPDDKAKLIQQSRASLEAAAPHIGISLGVKASIRNLFRNVGETFHAGIDEISEHHEQEIPAEIGGSTVAWADMNPFKSPFKNGRLR